MRTRLFAIVVIVGLIFALVATLRDEYVYAAVDQCGGTCPVGTNCELVGPGTWGCEPDGTTPPPVDPPNNDEPCGDSAAPSCGGYCDNGASCVTTTANPDCHCKANQGGAPMCPSGKVLKSFSPMKYLGSTTGAATCQFLGSCWGYFPSEHNITGCGGVETKGICELSRLCCKPDQVIACTTSSNDTHDIASTSCPAGEMKVAGWTVSTPVKNEEPINTKWVKCRRNCGRVCTTTSPTGLTISKGSLDTSAVMNWNPGTGGVSQKIYVDEDQAEVNANCPTAGDCIVKATVATTANTRNVPGLAYNTCYYFR